MSRRSRKRKAAGERRWLGKAAVAALVLAVVGLGAGFLILRNYLHSDSFRKFLSAEAGDAAAVTGEFEPFRWDGLAVDTDGFHATGDGMISRIDAEGLHTEIGLGSIGRGVWEVRGSGVRRLDVEMDTRRAPLSGKADAKRENTKKKATAGRSWFPREAELQGIDIGTLNAKVILDSGEASIQDLRIHAEQAGAKASYRAELTGGRARFPFEMVPELELERALVRYQDGHVYLTEAKLNAWQSARFTSTGEWDLKANRYSIEGHADEVNAADLLGETWSKRVSGLMASDFSMDNSSGQPVAKGKLTIHQGVLTALPVLDALAAYADTRRFRELTLNEAHTEWRWQRDSITLSKLVISSEGLVRLEGDLTIRGERIDGIFRLGLAPGTLRTIPGAETVVFLPGERGLLWTPLRITGTLDDPKEDLTDRLIAAAGIRMFDQIPETGEKVIKFTRSVIGDTPSKTVEKGVERGVKIIEEGSKTVLEVSGMIDGILGNRREREKEEEKK